MSDPHETEHQRAERYWRELREVKARLEIAIKALERISKDVYELNPWTVGESDMAKVAYAALVQIKAGPP